MEQKNKGIYTALIVLLAVAILFAGIAAFRPVATEVTEIDYEKINADFEAIYAKQLLNFKSFFKDEFNKVKIIEEVPVNCSETIISNPYLYRDKAWEYITDNWNKEDFDDELAYFDDEKYDLDEIDWEFNDEIILSGDFNKPDYLVEFQVTGDYDNDGEESYNIEISYYKKYKPEVIIT